MNAGGSVHPFTGDTSKARTHITVPIEEFCDKLGAFMADVEDKGTRAALLAGDIPRDRHMDWLEVMETGHDTRARLYAAQLKAMMMGMGK